MCSKLQRNPKRSCQFHVDLVWNDPRKLWAFDYVTSKQSYAIDFSLLISSLYAVKNGTRRQKVPSNGLSYSWRTQWCKLQLCTALHL